MSLKSESIWRQLKSKRDSLKDTEDVVGDGRVEEEEKDNESGGETTGGLGSVVAVKRVPEEETDTSQ